MRFHARALLVLLLVSVRLPAAAESRETTEGGVTRIVFPTGATLIVKPDSSVDTIAICLFVRAGVAEEEGISGLGSLTSRALFGSNDNQSREAVQRYIYGTSGGLEGKWTADYTLFSCVTRGESFPDAFYVMAQALKSAEFDPETLAAARKAVAAEAERERSDATLVGFAALRSRLYSDGPYRQTFGGTPESLRRITPQNVQNFFRKRYTPANTVVSIVGNVTVEQARKTVENQFIDYDRPAAKPAAPVKSSLVDDSAPLRRTSAINTTTVFMGFRGPGLTDPDYPAFRVLEALLGGGKSSRLFRSVRDEAGVGYAVGTGIPSLAKEGCLVAYVEYDPLRSGADGKPLSAEVVRQKMAESLQSVLSKPPTDTEVERAKRYAAGTHALAHQRPRDRAFYLGWYEAMGAGFAFDADLSRKIAAVTPADVQRLAKQVLAKYAVAIVQPEK